MDEKVLGFEEKLQKLLEEAKKKKNVLEEQEIQSFLRMIIWMKTNGMRCMISWMPIKSMSCG